MDVPDGVFDGVFEDVAVGVRVFDGVGLGVDVGLIKVKVLIASLPVSAIYTSTAAAE